MKTGLRIFVCIIGWMILPSLIQFSLVSAQEFVKPDFMVSDLTDFFYERPQLSISETSDMVIVWETVGSGGIWFKTISSMGNLLSEAQLVTSPHNYSQTRVTHADTGNFMVIYGGHDGYKWSVYGQVYDRNGDEIGDTLEVQRNTSEQINTYYLSLFADRNNQFGAFLPGFDSMIVEKISGTGEFVESNLVLKPDVPYVFEQTGVMTRSGAFIMVWRDGLSGDIRGQQYTPEGIPIGELFEVGQNEENSQLLSIAMAIDTSGNFAVVWKKVMDNKTDLYTQLFSSEGMRIGTNTRITDDQYISGSVSEKLSIDMDVDGKFVVAWSDNRNSDTSYIYLQQVDNQGELVGSNYRATTINNDITGPTNLPSQIDPSVKILHDTIYLSWVNYNQVVSNRSNIFSNIQKWMVPDVTGFHQQINTQEGAAIYPNPSGGIFSIIVDRSYSGRVELEVFNAAGALVKREIRHFPGKEAAIDLSEASEGLYYINIKGTSFNITTPLIIIK
ncbi:MAG: T9SS type A sorting domain-containing protein [Bacteroidetes bacterium]|nr:T9SS type A sorting domain-containing protein [Bacteroidota bacterium]